MKQEVINYIKNEVLIHPENNCFALVGYWFYLEVFTEGSGILKGKENDFSKKYPILYRTFLEVYSLETLDVARDLFEKGKSLTDRLKSIEDSIDGVEDDYIEDEG